VDDGILCDNAVLGRVDLDLLELDLSHATTDNEEITLADRAVGLAEVGSEENVKQRSSNALNGVGDGQDSNPLGVFDIGARQNGDHVAVLDTKVVANNSVDAGTAVVKLLVGKDNENSVLSLLASDQDGVAAKQLQSVHGGLGQGDNAVVIVDGIGDPRASISGLRDMRVAERRRFNTYMSWLAFFFFFRIAVEVSSSCLASPGAREESVKLAFFFSSG
jgi:hypothetical protein